MCFAKSYLDTQKRNVEMFTNNMPGWDWGQSFYGRHKNILMCVFEKKKNIRLKTAQVNKDVIKLFFENFEREANDVPTGNIFNYDETGFHDDPGRKN